MHLLDFFFPNACLECQKPHRYPFCSTCQQHLLFTIRSKKASDPRLNAIHTLTPQGPTRILTTHFEPHLAPTFLATLLLSLIQHQLHVPTTLSSPSPQLTPITQEIHTPGPYHAIVLLPQHQRKLPRHTQHIHHTLKPLCIDCLLII